MFATLLDLEGTLIESPTKDPMVISAYRSKLFPKFIKSGIPSYIINTSIPTAIVYNNALDYAINNFSTQKLQQFKSNIDTFMITKEVIWANQSKPFSYALNLLEQLKNSRIKIGLVTNTCKKATDIMLERGGLKKYLDIVITRTDVKRIKPDPESISLALNNLSIKDFFFVGDSELDALATKALGGISIIIKSNPLKRTFSANYFVNSLTEVFPIILANANYNQN